MNNGSQFNLLRSRPASRFANSPLDGVPPVVVGSGTSGVGVGVDTLLESQVGDGPPDGGALVGSPGVVEPVVSDGERDEELGNVEEVASVPVVAGDSKVLTGGRVTGGGLWCGEDGAVSAEGEVGEKEESAPGAQSTRGRPTWCRWTTCKRIPSA